jgi:hypothetical protein
MKPILGVGVSTVALALLGASTLARADLVPLDDPLHGYCAGAGQCIDNGTNSPTSNNPPVNFGFTVSPGPASGSQFLMDVLVPDNKALPPSFAITGPSGTATLFSATPWTSGNLDSYLGISASPANPIGAFLPSTQALDPGATGFFVFQVDLGAITLQGPANPNVSPLMNISPNLPIASYIVAFLNEGTAAAPNWIATANSGAIFEDAPPGGGGGNFIPEPGTLMLLGVAAVAAGFSVRRRS